VKGPDTQNLTSLRGAPRVDEIGPATGAGAGVGADGLVRFVPARPAISGAKNTAALADVTAMRAGFGY